MKSTKDLVERPLQLTNSSLNYFITLYLMLQHFNIDEEKPLNFYSTKSLFKKLKIRVIYLYKTK